MSRILAAALAGALAFLGAAEAADPLPSWRDGPARAAIVAFVEAATTEGDAGYLPADARIAVFDNDGTLWAEQPAYSQLLFAVDRVRAMAPERPEWREAEPFASVLKGDLAGLAASGEEGLLALIGATHGGMTPDAFATLVGDWLAEARHPTLDRPYTQTVYEPMLELMDYLRAHGFEVYIVSGGGQEFIRVFAEEVYGVPPENVIGSRIALAYDDKAEGGGALTRGADIAFVDDKSGKPVGIYERIGRRPAMAFGNSDGDYQMLDWTTSGDGPRFGAIVHHDDAERESAYDRGSSVGRLERALDDAADKGWTVVSMREDWAEVFPDAD